jgi:hypothetical protein
MSSSQAFVRIRGVSLDVQPAGYSSWAPEGASNPIDDDLNDVLGLPREAVEEYATWHMSRVGTESHREDIRKTLVPILPDIIGEFIDV